MAKTSKKVSKDYINELNQDFLREQYIDAPFTQIENRAQIIVIQPIYTSSCISRD